MKKKTSVNSRKKPEKEKPRKKEPGAVKANEVGATSNAQIKLLHPILMGKKRNHISLNRAVKNVVPRRKFRSVYKGSLGKGSKARKPFSRFSMIPTVKTKKSAFSQPKSEMRANARSQLGQVMRNRNLAQRKRRENTQKLNIKVLRPKKENEIPELASESKGGEPGPKKVSNSQVPRIFSKKRAQTKKFKSCDFVSNLEICRTIKKLKMDNSRFIRKYQQKKLKLPLLIFHKRYLALHQMLGDI